MEDELGEALPYWDWTEDKDVPDLWEEIRAPLKPPLKSECGADRYGNGYGSKGYDRKKRRGRSRERRYGGKGYGSEGDDGYGDGGGGGYGEGSGYKSFVARKTNININVRLLKRVVRYALKSDNFVDFSERISIPHRLVHTRVGCDMVTTEKAAYDPVFYLHNTFIDYLWAYWQELQRLRSEDDRDHFINKIYNVPLPPFDRADFNKNKKTLRHNKGRDVLDYKSNLCYEYDDLRFDGKTPAQFLKHMDAMADAASDNGYVYGKGRGYDDEDSRSIEVKEGYGQGHDKGYGKGYGYKG